MAASTASAIAELGDVARWRATYGWFEIDAMSRFRDAEMARTAHVEPAMRRQVERSAIAVTIGEAMNLSEGQVQLRLPVADRAREQTPAVWAAFTDGLVDLIRVRDISATIEKLHRDESVDRLDRLVIAYATDHTAAELRQGLRRFVQRVEAGLAVEREPPRYDAGARRVRIL
jgi:hypothetical protein